MSNVTEKDWVEEVGAPAYASIVEMVSALKCDYDRLEELRDDEGALNDRQREELAELEEAAGVHYDSQQTADSNRDNARQRIEEDALSVEMRGAWYGYGTEPADAAKPVEFKILLATGGPAVQIRGELNEHGEPGRAWLEVQDWGKPWTQYFKADRDTLLTYARCFYFGEG